MVKEAESKRLVNISLSNKLKLVPTFINICTGSDLTKAHDSGKEVQKRFRKNEATIWKNVRTFVPDHTSILSFVSELLGNCSHNDGLQQILTYPS